MKSTNVKFSSTKKTARIVGALFITAIVVSLVGGILIESILDVPDFLLNVSENESLLMVGVLLELANAVAVVGIAVLLFPILKMVDEGLALGYVAFRIIETVIIVAALISPLIVLGIGQDYLEAGASDPSYFQTLGNSIIETRSYLLGQILGIVFSLAALLFYCLTYRSRLIPRWLSIWGLIAVALLFTWNLLELVGISISVGIIFGLPMILNELLLGIWLIVKGFNSASFVFEDAA